MNGKNRRTKGCWSRGSPSRSAFLSNPRSRAPHKSKYYTPPRFKKDLLGNLNNSQLALATFFQNYPVVQRLESFRYNSNTPYAIVKLKQTDFDNGTVRLRTPGVYILQEDITFNPNESNDFLPTAAQVSSGLYPQNMKGPYHLGFFTALAIEANDVIVELNGFSIQQSAKHNLQQRFYSNIELAIAPFIPNQGPGDFKGAMVYKAADRVLIRNGFLRKSSHHGIHANTANRVFLEKLFITDFEVAGIALNGTTTAVISEISINSNMQDIKVLSTYSQARFIRTFLDAVEVADPTASFNSLSIAQIKQNLNNDLNATFSAFSSGQSLPDNYFKNPNVGYDGNVYGMVLNVNGVVVNNFITARTGQMIGNTDIYLDTIVIQSISSHPIEVIGVNADPSSNVAYGGKVQVGPIGDVVKIEALLDNNSHYAGSSLSDAQMIIAKSATGPKGTTNIDPDIYNWASSSPPASVTTVINSNLGGFYYVGGGDSMGHHMKGNIGLFISAGKDIRGNNIHVIGVANRGTDVGNSTLSPLSPAVQSKEGSAASSVLITGSENITLINTLSKLSAPTSDNGGIVDIIRYVGTNSQISVT